MKIRCFDAHTDTLSRICENGQNFAKNSFHTDFERMKKYLNYTQIFAAFADKRKFVKSYYSYIMKQLDKFDDEMGKCGISRIRRAVDVGKEKYSALLALEGGEVLCGQLQRLDLLYDRGVRLLTLTWNYDNELCGGADGQGNIGLTKFGKSVVRRMNEIGMMVDVSHISQAGFYDVADFCDKPFIASHSNVRKLCNHRRNLTDGQIKTVIEHNGVIGINFYPIFLDESGKCSVEKILEHIEYIINLGGENNVGIGTDFDGIDCLPLGVTGIESIKMIFELMKKRGYSEEIIDKIMYKNFERAFKEILK